jgi:hypothetical protein
MLVVEYHQSVARARASQGDFMNWSKSHSGILGLHEDAVQCAASRKLAIDGRNDSSDNYAERVLSSQSDIE